MAIDLIGPCPCPVESRMQLLIRLAANLNTLFSAMAEDYVGVEVNPNGCGCTEVQLLAAINQNIVEFGRTYTGGGGGSGNMILVAVPASSASPGAVGEFAVDENFFYAYDALVGWARTPISGW